MPVTPMFPRLIICLMACLMAGCGTTSQRMATEQLVQSDAVDTAIADIDFSPLAGQRCFLDPQYVVDYNGIGFVNSKYIISAIRQEMTADGLLLQDNAADADIIVEPRVGTLGSDDHDVLYGIPASNALNSAASALPSMPALPAIPEIAFMKKDDLMAAAKIGVFAYHQETRLPVWQSGTTIARSTSKDTWVMGAGPFTRGSIYQGWRFAGTRVNLPLPFNRGAADRPEIADFHQEHLFHPELLVPEAEVEPETMIAEESETDSEVVPASNEVPAE